MLSKLQVPTNNITTGEVITGALKFENCKFENRNFNVTAGKNKSINK
jgi:hypothetical protein